MIGRKRNDNIFKPVRVSSQLMEVFDTTVRYQEPNEVRAMLAKYKKKLAVLKKSIFETFIKLVNLGCEQNAYS